MAALTLALALTAFAIGDDGGPLKPTPAPEVADTQEPDEDVTEPTPSESAYGVWDRLAMCESTQRWSIATGNGYYGGLQFDYGTWLRHGGGKYARTANLATRAQQIEIAIRTQAAQGWGAWPYCSRRLGLR